MGAPLVTLRPYRKIQGSRKHMIAFGFGLVLGCCTHITTTRGIPTGAPDPKAVAKISKKQGCLDAGCCWTVKDPAITYLATQIQPACWEMNIPKASREACNDENGQTIADASECEQNGCCFDDTDPGKKCYYRAIYDKDICHAKRHATNAGVCRFVGSTGYVFSAFFPFYNCARRSCGTLPQLENWSYQSTGTDFITTVFHWRNTPTDTMPGTSIPWTNHDWRIQNGGAAHPCFSVRTSERCVVKCDLSKQIAGPDQWYTCQWDSTTSQMRLKGDTPAYKGGPCDGTPSGSPTQYPCPPGPPPHSGQALPAGAGPAECICCIKDVCTTEGHDELNSPLVTAPLCGSLKKRPSATAAWTNKNECIARCVSGFEDKHGRNPVKYNCPFNDIERSNNANINQIRVIPDATEYASISPVTDRIIQCQTMPCTAFSNTVVETDTTGKYDKSLCAIPGVTYSTELASECTVTCGIGFLGVPVKFRCVGVNDPYTPTAPAAAQFRGLNDVTFETDVGIIPACTAAVCTLYSSAGAPLASPAARYEKASPTIKDPAQTGAVAVGCEGRATDEECTLQCKPGYTPKNTMTYVCFNRLFGVGAGALYHHVPKVWYTDVIANPQSSADLIHLKCPAQMCTYSSLPPATGSLVGINMGDCFGRVTDEECTLDCVPGYLKQVGTSGDDKLTCQGSHQFSAVGASFECVAQECTSNFPITTIASTCGSRLAPESPCPCRLKGGTVPGCLGIVDTTCIGLKTGENCMPSCLPGFSRHPQTGSKTLLCVGQSYGGTAFQAPVGSLLWEERKGIYKEDTGMSGKVVHSDPSAYLAGDHFGFKYGLYDEQIQGWTAKPKEHGGWRQEKGSPLNADGLDSGLSNKNAMRINECFRFCDHLEIVAGKPCAGVSVVDGMYCIPLVTRDRADHHGIKNLTDFHNIFAHVMHMHDHHVAYTGGMRFITHKHVPRLRKSSDEFLCKSWGPFLDRTPWPPQVFRFRTKMGVRGHAMRKTTGGGRVHRC